jgi:hypothetical protein
VLLIRTNRNTAPQKNSANKYIRILNGDRIARESLTKPGFEVSN